jgi:hypothetical protein
VAAEKQTTSSPNPWIVFGLAFMVQIVAFAFWIGGLSHDVADLKGERALEKQAAANQKARAAAEQIEKLEKLTMIAENLKSERDNERRSSPQTEK